MSSTSKVNTEGVLLFEQPFIKVPYENYKKVFRTSQKNIERELGAVQTAAVDLVKRSKGSTGVDAADAAKSVDAMIARVETLKRKLSELQESAGRPTQDVIRHRLEYLATVETAESPSDPEFVRWADKRLDRWLVDWALRHGKGKTARTIAEAKDIQSLVDIDLFTDIHRIEHALHAQSCSEALLWCNENKSALRKIKSTLEFDLRLQEYIELARVRKTQEAIAYARKHFITWQDTHMAQIRQATALLAFGPDTTCGPYRRLYDTSRWSTLIQAFRVAVYTLNSLPTEPLLHLALYAGLASLKLAVCYDPATKNVDCPVCQDLGQLAAEVPFSHHLNSTIVCRISGKIMDGDNMPMAFPNGNVYSREALEDMAARHGGQVTCPRSGLTVEFSALRKVFIS